MYGTLRHVCQLRLISVYHQSTIRKDNSTLAGMMWFIKNHQEKARYQVMSGGGPDELQGSAHYVSGTVYGTRKHSLRFLTVHQHDANHQWIVQLCLAFLSARPA